MDRRDVDGLLSSLDASFDASLAREEDEAASDLAFSLAQDQCFHEVAARAPGLGLRLAGAFVPVTIVGLDYLGTSDVLVPREHVVAETRAGAEPPASHPLTLLNVLRSLARGGTKVAITTPEQVVTGRLICACEDHVQMKSRGRVVLMGFGAIRRIRIDRENSTDAF